MSLTVVTSPAIEPLTLEEAKAWMRVDTTADDVVITSLIAQARSEVEQRTTLRLLTQTLRLDLDAWPADPAPDTWWDGVREGPISLLSNPRPISLPVGPIQSVTSVQTLDETGATTAFTGWYLADAGTRFARIILKANTPPPAILRSAGGLRVTFVAGWTDKALIDARVVRAVWNLVGYWYENRGAVDPKAKDKINEILAPLTSIASGYTTVTL
jgi:hypothetical protein